MALPIGGMVAAVEVVKPDFFRASATTATANRVEARRENQSDNLVFAVAIGVWRVERHRPVEPGLPFVLAWGARRPWR